MYTRVFVCIHNDYTCIRVCLCVYVMNYPCIRVCLCVYVMIIHVYACVCVYA